MATIIKFKLRWRGKNGSNNLEINTKPPIVDNQEKKENLKSRYVLPEREFKHRRSVLIELFEDNQNIRSIYNIILSFFVVFVVTVLVKECFQYNRFPTPLSLIYRCFGKLHLVFIIWLINNMATISIYYCFLFWVKIRQKAKNKNNWDRFCMVILAAYYLLSFSFITMVINRLQIPFASSLILCLESVRFLMKIHAFIRSNAGKLLKKENGSRKIPSISTFLYFLYIPTAVYRDEYPRTEFIRWSFVFFRALEIVGVIVLYSFGFEYVVRPILKDVCLQKSSLLDFLVFLLQLSIPSVIMVWSIFFVLLHSSQNLVGELLRFGDRKFYSDWWTVSDVPMYYKKWNMVIGDWLYTYIYKDICDNISSDRTTRMLAKVITIMVSAFVHEWVATVSNGFFLPIVTFNMAFTALLPFRVRSVTGFKNFLAMLAMTVGCGGVGVLFSTEYFARKNLNVKDVYAPVFFSQNCSAFM